MRDFVGFSNEKKFKCAMRSAKWPCTDQMNVTIFTIQFLSFLSFVHSLFHFNLHGAWICSFFLSFFFILYFHGIPFQWENCIFAHRRNATRFNIFRSLCPGYCYYFYVSFPFSIFSTSIFLIFLRWSVRVQWSRHIISMTWILKCDSYYIATNPSVDFTWIEKKRAVETALHSSRPPKQIHHPKFGFRTLISYRWIKCRTVGLMKINFVRNSLLLSFWLNAVTDFVRISLLWHLIAHSNSMNIFCTYGESVERTSWT